MKTIIGIGLHSLLSSCMLISFSSWAQATRLSCKDSQREILARYGAPDSPGSFLHGQQLFIRKAMAAADDPSPLLLRRTPSTMTTYRFSKDCSSVSSHELNLQAVLDQFEIDKILTKSAQKKKGAVLYIWSPRMPLSISGIEQARSAAKKVGVDFVVAADGVISERERVQQLDRGLVKKGDLLIFRPDLMTSENSIALTVAHYPTVFFIKDGKVFGSGFPGYKSTVDYTNLFRIALGGSHN